jgi:methoxymalonate biosynthesis acyl carrier protein
MDTKDRIRAFLGDRCPGELRDDDDIFETGLANSLFVMQLVLFVEQEFGFVVRNEDLERDNFRSVNTITRLVEQNAN